MTKREKKEFKVSLFNVLSQLWSTLVQFWTMMKNVWLRIIVQMLCDREEMIPQVGIKLLCILSCPKLNVEFIVLILKQMVPFLCHQTKSEQKKVGQMLKDRVDYLTKAHHPSTQELGIIIKVMMIQFWQSSFDWSTCVP